jgi:flagellar hook protein FlgE
MVSALSSTVSAINALDKKMAVISNNIANSESDGFKKSRADLKEGDSGGVEVNITQVNTPGPTVTVDENNTTVEKEMSNVDLAEELPQSMITQTGYNANLKMVKTQDEMLGTLLDTFS